MVMIHIWTLNGECRSIPMVEDSEEYKNEIQVLESDPFVENYSVAYL